MSVGIAVTLWRPVNVAHILESTSVSVRPVSMATDSVAVVKVRHDLLSVRRLKASVNLCYQNRI